MATIELQSLTAFGDYDRNQKRDISVRISQVELLNSTTRDCLESKKGDFPLPDAAFDTHVHIFDPRLGPYSPTRSYTPDDASFASLTAFSQTLSSSTKAVTFVLVQPSPYRTDNSGLLQTLSQCRLNGIAARGIAVVDVDNITNAELEHMHSLGVRGLRLNFQADGKEANIESLKSTIRTTAGRISHLPGWMLQIYAPSYIWTGLHDTIMNLAVPIIADHVGGLYGASKLPLELANNPTQQSGFQALVSLAKASRVFIKISGLYRASDHEESDYSDMEPIIRRLAIEAPNRLLWGSDWPHTGEGKDRVKNKNLEVTEPFRVVDNLGILKNLREWVGSEEVWKTMIVDTPRLAFQ